MDYFAGLDVSVKDTSVCIVDGVSCTETAAASTLGLRLPGLACEGDSGL
jgi:hypothetical protein